MIALLVATLIGVFITPDGIVIGADTALSTLGGQVANQQKYCITGPRSVATMQGAYLLEDTVTKATVELHNRFRDLCGQVGNSLSPMTLEQQAALVAREVVSVRRALTRIENGTYGSCARCGEEIASKRLEARPEAALCIDCARKEQ